MRTAFIAFKKTTCSILTVLCLSLSPIALSLKGADWNWHQEFPWVYNNDESDWHYWRAGTDGNFYLWKNKLQKWYQFDSINKQWLQVLRLKPVLLTFPFPMGALPGNIFSMFPPLTTDQHRFHFCLIFTDLEAPPPHI